VANAADERRRNTLDVEWSALMRAKQLTRVREIRDEVKQRVQRLLEQHGWTSNKVDAS
jgi:hypothetical protein